MIASISGELGDCAFSLPALRALGARTLLGVNRPWTRLNFSQRILSLKSLLEEQDYIDHVGPHNGEHIDIDISPFRRSGLLNGVTIPERIARYCRVKPDLEKPWIAVEPDARSRGRILINQCERWESWYFPWRQIVQAFGNDLLFVGLPQEHNEFQEQFGKVPYLPTKDLHEVARLIAGSELFIGNQSSCNAIAEGLKHRKVLAVCLYACDCFFSGPHATYCLDGSLSFEACGKSFRSEAVKFMPRFNTDGLDRALLLSKAREIMLNRGIV